MKRWEEERHRENAAGEEDMRGQLVLRLGARMTVRHERKREQREKQNIRRKSLVLEEGPTWGKLTILNLLRWFNSLPNFAFILMGNSQIKS